MNLKNLTVGVLVSAGAFLAACHSAPPAASGNQPLAMASSTPTPSTDRSAVVAKIDGEAVTAGDLDESVKGPLIRTDVEYLEKRQQLRSDGLEALINKRLIDKKAKAAGQPAEAFLEKEVFAKVQLPSDEEEKALYDQAVANGKELPPFAQVKDEIAQFVGARKREAALKAYTDGLRKEAKVETMLPPPVVPKIAVEAVGPSKGDANAPITIVEFSDYQCPFCGRAEPTVKAIVDQYKGKVRLVYREYPLPMHEYAQKASEAALCADEQGKFWEMHEKLFENQSALTIENLKSYAKGLALDTAKFDKCLDGGDKAKSVQASLKAGEDVGVSGTPAFFINGRPLFGAVPAERFKEIIDAELADGQKKL
jgi:protein-disulfide isomerase